MQFQSVVDLGGDGRLFGVSEHPTLRGHRVKCGIALVKENHLLRTHESCHPSFSSVEWV